MANHSLRRLFVPVLIALALGHAARAAEGVSTSAPTSTGAQYKRVDGKFYAHGDILKADPTAVILPPTALAQNGEIYTYTPKKKAPKFIFAEVPNDWIEPITPPDMTPLNIAPDAMQVREPHGDVQVAMPSAPTSFSPAADGEPLPNGAVIKTGDNSTAAILFGGVDSARLMPNSEAAVQQAVASTSRAAEVDLTVGGVFSKVGTQVGVQSDYQVHTPFGTALTAGGDFVTLLTNNRIDLWVSAGTVELLQPDGKKFGAATGDGKGPLKLIRYPAAGADAISADADSLSTILGFIPMANQKLAALHQKAAANVPLTANEQTYLTRIKQVPALIKLALIIPPPAFISVQADGKVDFMSQTLNADQLRGVLTAYAPIAIQPEVNVKADPGVSYADFQAVIAACKATPGLKYEVVGTTPTAPPPPLAAQDVVVTAGGMVKLNGAALKIDDFTTKLKAIIGAAPDVTVTVHADAKAAFADISAVIDACKGAPVKNLNIRLPKLTDLSVSAHQDGTIGFHGATLKLDEFSSDLKAAVALFPDLPITLHSNPAMDYAKFKAVSDACNAAGAKQVTVVQPAPQPPAPPTFKAFVQADGSVKFQDASLKLDEFATKIKDAVTATPDAPVTLKADPKANDTNISAAIDAIKAAGAKNFNPTLPVAKELSVTVHGDSSILFHGATISADDFPNEIKAAVALYPDAPIVIHSNPKADYTKFQAVVDACKAASTKEVTVVQPAPEPPKPVAVTPPPAPAPPRVVETPPTPAPAPAPEKPAAPPQPLTVVAHLDGSIKFEGKTMQIDEFTLKIKDAVAKHPDVAVIIHSNPKMDFAKFQSVVDACKNAPAKEVDVVPPAPQAGAAPASVTPVSPETVVLRANGNIKFQNSTMDLSALETALKTLVTANPDQALIIKADPKADYTKFLALQDACKDAGIKNVTIASPAPQLPKPAEPATVLVHDDGSVGFLGQRGTLDEFKTKVAAMVAATPDRELIIKTSGDKVPYENVKAVLDACSDAHVAHVTAPEPPATPPVTETPSTTAAPTPPAPAPVNDKPVPAQIDLAADGSLKLDGTAITEDDLKVKLADIKSTNPKNPLVMIKQPGVTKDQWTHYVDLAHSMELKLLVKNGKGPAIQPMAATPPSLRPSAAEGGPAIQPLPAPEQTPAPETPSTNAPPAISTTEEAVPVEIELTPDGLVAFLGETVSDGELQKRLNNVARANVKEPVLIVKDEKVTHEQLQHVIDMCRAAKLRFKVKVVKSSDTGALKPHASLPLALQPTPAAGGNVPAGKRILPVEIGLATKGRITFEGQSVTLEELKARLNTIAQGNPNQPVVIMKQADVTDGSVDALVTVCQGVSAQLKISVQTAPAFLPMNAPADNLRARSGNI